MSYFDNFAFIPLLPFSHSDCSAGRIARRLSQVIQAQIQYHRNTSIILTQYQQNNTVLSPVKFVNFCNDFLSFFRYFSRFTKGDYMNYSLLGNEPVEKFSSFDQELTELMNVISTEMKLWSEEINMPASRSYTVYCNVLPAIRRLDKEQQRQSTSHTSSKYKYMQNSTFR